MSVSSRPPAPAVPLSSLPFSLPKTSNVQGIDHVGVAASWVERLTALRADHFVKEAYWRDLLALTGTFRTFQSPQSIIFAWKELTEKYSLSDLQLVPNSSAIRSNPTISWIHARFTFRVSTRPAAKCSGILRLVPDADGRWKIWVLSTILEEIEGLDNPDVLLLRSQQKLSATEDSPSQISLRKRKDERRPRSNEFGCVVIGAGMAGLSTLSRLRALGVSAIAVERHRELGGNWLARYDSIALHTPRELGQMPFGRFFTAEDPIYLTAKELSRGYKAFADECGLDVWCSTNVEAAVWDETAQRWTLSAKRDGHYMEIKSSHIVFAVGGFGAVPKMPKLPDPERFAGKVMHSVVFKNAKAWKGKNGVVIGAGTTAHDIAFDMYANGLCSVTMVQRGPTAMVLEPYMRYLWDPVSERAWSPYKHLPDMEQIYNEKANVPEVDREGQSMPVAISRFMTNEDLKAWAKDVPHLFEPLERVGFKFDRYPDLFHHLFERSGGHYVDIGNASPKIADGSVGSILQTDHCASADYNHRKQIKLKHAMPSSFTSNGLKFDDGTELDADVVVFCTGFETNMRIAIEGIVGGDIAEQAGDYGEFDAEGELRNGWTTTGHPALWYAGGAINQSRFLSRFLALQIKAALAGVPLRPYTKSPVDDGVGQISSLGDRQCSRSIQSRSM